MKTGYSYNMRQVQKLAMTKEMQLSINILQMSSQELKEFMEEEFIDNPVIEIDEDLPINIEETDFNILKVKPSNKEENISPLNFVSEKKSLKDFLHEQILEVEDDKIIRKTADYLVECLNDSGYFQMKEKEVARELLVDIKIVDRSLKLIQSLEPYGVGAKNLKECLTIQLRHLGISDNNIYKVIESNLKDIGEDNFLKIAKELNITRKEVQKYASIIKKLEPKPSRGFYTGEDYKYIIPDAEIRRVGKNLDIIINNHSIPGFVVSNTYKKILREKSNEEVEQYIKEKLVRAEQLLRSIEERKNTLKKILEFIVVKQYGYFMGINKFLKPMTIKEVAQSLKYSDSTVSRAIKNKFVLTEFGVLKIKDLFTINSIKNSDKDISVDYIKKNIQEIISKEDTKSPLSDQDIVEELKKVKIYISRRTIAKYREEMGIKSSHKRKIF